MRENIYEDLPEPPAPESVVYGSVRLGQEWTALRMDPDGRACQHCGVEIDTRIPHARAYFRLETDATYADGTPKTRSYRVCFCDAVCWEAWASADLEDAIVDG